jgi:hypothetical protein
MASKTQYKHQIDGYELEIKKLRYQLKVCNNSLELEKKKTIQLETALAEKKVLKHTKKWYEFWK